MTKKFLLIFISILSLSSSGFSQSKGDYVWIFGVDNRNNIEGIESYIFDFNEGSSPKDLRGTTNIEISQANASICDENGNLLLYSNGCAIAGSDHKVLPNGLGINEGEWITQFRNDTCVTYPGTQDIMFLPDPGNDQGYYLFHKTNEISNTEDYRTLKHSYIDLNLNNGLGEVILKNVTTTNHRYLYGYLTAIKHKNQKDIWLTQPLSLSDSIAVFLIDDNGIKVNNFAKTNQPFQRFSSASGTAKFSPDGTKFALYNAYDDLLLYNFDRETGRLSNLKELKVLNLSPPEIRFSCIEWSPNSQFVYLGTSLELWQVDITEPQLEDGLELIDTWDGTMDPFATTFVLAALAPDCKIYITPGSSSRTYHVINEPNKKGQDCNFVQRGIALPHISTRATLPNFPRFRVDEADKCDPTITSIFGDQVYYRRDLSVYPNPITDFVNIEIPDNQSGQLFLFDLKGQLVWKETAPRSEIKRVDFSFLAAGRYSLEFVPDKNGERLIWTTGVLKALP